MVSSAASTNAFSFVFAGASTALWQDDYQVHVFGESLDESVRFRKARAALEDHRATRQGRHVARRRGALRSPRSPSPSARPGSRSARRFGSRRTSSSSGLLRRSRGVCRSTDALQRWRAATWRSWVSCSVISRRRIPPSRSRSRRTAAKSVHGDSIRVGPSRRTSRTAISAATRSRNRLSIDRLTNRTPAGGVGTRPATAMVSTAGTCVVSPRNAAADTPAGPAPAPATAMPTSKARGSGIPTGVRGPFQYKPRRTRATSPFTTDATAAHSTSAARPRQVGGLDEGA